MIRDEETQKLFWRDLDALQSSKSCKVFEQAVVLFVAKWENESKEFMKYFKDEWLIKNPHWFEGIAKLVPSTNNALESFNRLIKDEQTFRKRTELKIFRIQVFDMIKQWSVEYDAGLKVINNDGPRIDLFLWTMAYQWSIANVNPTIKQQKFNTIYRISTSAGTSFQ